VTKILSKFHVIQDKTLTWHCVACVKNNWEEPAHPCEKNVIIMLHIKPLKWTESFCRQWYPFTSWGQFAVLPQCWKWS